MHRSLKMAIYCSLRRATAASVVILARARRQSILIFLSFFICVLFSQFLFISRLGVSIVGWDSEAKLFRFYVSRNFTVPSDSLMCFGPVSDMSLLKKTIMVDIWVIFLSLNFSSFCFQPMTRNLSSLSQETHSVILWKTGIWWERHGAGPPFISGEFSWIWCT